MVLVSYPKLFVGYESKHSAQNRHYGTNDNEEPVQHPLPPRYLIAKDLEVEQQGEDDTDSETQGGPNERYNSIESGNQNGKGNEHHVNSH
jgi:hypothetical protein